MREINIFLINKKLIKVGKIYKIKLKFKKIFYMNKVKPEKDHFCYEILHNLYIDLLPNNKDVQFNKCKDRQ